MVYLSQHDSIKWYLQCNVTKRHTNTTGNFMMSYLGHFARRSTIAGEMEKLGIPLNKSTVTASKEWRGKNSLPRLQEEYCLREAASPREWCARRGEGACPCRRGTRQAGSWISQSTNYDWSDTILETRTICLHWWWPPCTDRDTRTRTTLTKW